MNALIVAALLAQPSPSVEYTNDELCRSKGETKETVLHPEDREFFEKTCVCFRDYFHGAPLGCAAKGSETAARLAKMEKSSVELRNQQEKEQARREVRRRIEEAKRIVDEGRPAAEEKEQRSSERRTAEASR